MHDVNVAMNALGRMFTFSEHEKDQVYEILDTLWDAGYGKGLEYGENR